MKHIELHRRQLCTEHSGHVGRVSTQQPIVQGGLLLVQGARERANGSIGISQAHRIERCEVGVRFQSLTVPIAPEAKGHTAAPTEAEIAKLNIDRFA